MAKTELENRPSPIELHQRNSSLVINPQGALIEKLTIDGKNIFWNGIRPDGNIAASHLSLPWFGSFMGKLQEGVDNPGNHGPARKELWQIYDNSAHAAQLILKMPELDQLYPNLHAFTGVHVNENSFLQLVTLDNRSTIQQANINPGIHWYWNIQTPEIENISINGDKYSLEEWKNATLLPANEDNFIEVPSLGKIKLQQKGFSNIIIWTQTDENEQASFGCIELGNDPKKIATAKPIQSGEFAHYFGKITVLE